MGIFNFFKRNKKKEIKTESFVLAVSLNDAKEQIKREFNLNEEFLSSILRDVDSKRNEFLKDLSLHIDIVKKIDLAEKRERERVKLINMQNLKEYIRHLERLYSRIKEQKLVDSTSLFEMNKLFVDFINSSRRNLALATILVGEEIQKIEDLVKEFHKHFLKIFEDKKEVFSVLRKKDSLFESLSEINSLYENISFSKEDISKYEIKKTNLEKELLLLKENLNEFTASLEYQKFQEEKKNISFRREKLAREFSSIKEKMDLKSLYKKYHGLNKEKNLIEDYRNDFAKAIKKDSSLKILEFFGSSRNSFEEKLVILLNELKELEILEEKFAENKEEIQILSNIGRIEEEISKLEENILAEEKKISRFEEKRKWAIDEFNLLIKDLKGFNFYLKN